MSNSQSTEADSRVNGDAQTQIFENIGNTVNKPTDEASDEPEQKLVEEIESLCMNCHANGITKLLLTRIPFFREIIIMSFYCPHCGFQNSEVQPAGEIQQRGQRYTFKVDQKTDLNRQIVKSDTCALKVEDIDLEIPPGRGQMTNVEGILSLVAQDLEQKQPERKEQIPEVYEKIEVVINTLRAMSQGQSLPFTIVLDDPAGNSYVEPSTSDKGGKYLKMAYDRTSEQNAALGLGDSSATEAPDTEIRPEYQANQQMVPEMPARPIANNVDEDDIVENQVYSFPASCPGCTKSCVTNMKMVNIPHFKQVVLMSTVCDHCGYRSNEVKTGGEVPEKGRRIAVSVEKPEDLSRDILKSESCAMSCPELDLSVEPGTLGGRFTTIEGLLTNVRDDLRASVFDISGGGDSMISEERTRWTAFFERLDSAIAGSIPFKLILSDPLASSYVQSFTAPEPDSQIQVEDYDRTAEEEEDLGLKDMKTENYREDFEEAGQTEAEIPLTEEERAKQFLEKVVR